MKLETKRKIFIKLSEQMKRKIFKHNLFVILKENKKK